MIPEEPSRIRRLLISSHPQLPSITQSKPGELNYASGPAGAPTHLGAELFKAMVGVNIVRIPYKSTGQAVTDLIAGHVQMSFANPGSVVPHINSGRLRALAVSSAGPS